MAGTPVRYDAADGWELCDGNELLAGHDGLDAGDVAAAHA